MQSVKQVAAPALDAIRREPARIGRTVVDPACWTGAELAATSDWIIELNAAEVSDLRAMAKEFARRIGGEPDRLLSTTRVDFDLGAFGPKLQRVKRDLTDGRGLVLLRGLPIEDMSEVETAVVYWGIGRQLGNATSNNAQGDMIGLVLDKGKDINAAQNRGYETNASMMYHSDPCHIVALLCMQSARSGGESKIVSSLAVYNELLRTRPDLIDVLSAPYCWTLHGEVNPGERGYYEGPVLNFIDGYLSVALAPLHMIKGHKVPGAPRMTAPQAEALEAVETTCEALHYSMALRQGDIQILNNSVILHARTVYEDYPDPAKRRRLWRLWLDAAYIRPLPLFHLTHRNGIRVVGNSEHIDLEQAA